MSKQDQQKQIQLKLCFGSILFGVALSIGVFFIFYFGHHIEFKREHSSFLINILLWFIEWIHILFGIALPWFTWKKLVKPYIDF